MGRNGLTPAIEAQALALRNAYGSGAPVAPIRFALPEATIKDACAIQAVNTSYWLSQGRRAVGAKIDLVSRAAQAHLEGDQPAFGTLYADMSVNDGGTVPADPLLQPKIAGKIAFVIGKTPDPNRLTAAELTRSIEFALPAIEIVDSRIAGWDISAVDAIADNGSSALFVLGGSPKVIADFDLALCGVAIEKNGEPTAFGAGVACLGNPLHAYGWLVDEMAAVGRPVQAGDVILSGALAPTVAVQAGDHVDMRINGLGSARVRFAGT